MSYPESVEYLYALGNELKAGAKFGLERMSTLLAPLNHPERGQHFIHVAGTNGKGSTCAMIAGILQAAGLHTGLYTSPHLIQPTERIRLDHRDISPEDFAAAFTAVHQVAEQLVRDGRIDAHPSYFETVTAMALLVFRDRAQISVMEVGLGGRLDATNVITPELCVITPVSYDHEAYLGNRLESIAGEKAGILKPGVPAVIARQEPAAAAVIEKRGSELGCPLLHLTDAHLELLEITPDGARFQLDGEEYTCPLPGRHQVENAALAILACRMVRQQLPPVTIQAGLNKTSWPGRLERVSRHPDFFLDGAHNPAGAAALAAYIREFYSARPVWLVFGTMRDKAIEEVTEQLFPLADRLILTAPDFPRALRPQAILDASPISCQATLTANLAEAIALARQAPANAAVFFTGSLYLVGEARKLLCD